AQQTLIGPGRLARPGRGIPIRRPYCVGSKRNRSDSPAAVVRVTDECRVRVADAPVEPEAEQIAKQRAGGDAAEVGEIRAHELRVYPPALLVALPIAEEENTVPADGPAEGETELSPLEERIEIRRVTVQSRIRGQLVVAEEIESGAVEIVASGARDHVDRPCGGNTGRKVKIHGRNLELLHHFLGEAHLRASHAHRRDAAPIHREDRPTNIDAGRP